MFSNLKQYIQKCEENLRNWEKFKQDYVKLKERLVTLSNELKYDVMVGKIISSYI